MLMVPFLTIILASKGYPADLTVKMAVATSLRTICFTSLSSVRAHQKRGAVLWPVVKVLAPGILVGSLLGAQIAVALPGKLLGILFAGLRGLLRDADVPGTAGPSRTRTLPGPVAHLRRRQRDRHAVVAGRRRRAPSSRCPS
jgi:hypothetical protein